ncbi:MAG: serine/threonine-protein kinase [Enterobacteriaceae bacterium]|uniref:serine/threonine-protein kinase n=1 Tax=Hafnia paralvei TaxID=546367 RepID=UPI000ED1C376|nr:serine/threonine-protein kinase [Hafnia paralvei]MDU1193390.1 serine/threonine-protein kinase [Enterobacteriaceae bacterium]MDU1245485.1 serine/threonine-protein kinase [Enterobacteriaceae bacterium]HCU14307.1 serine/threonine protein kinase [Hafnia paralvei]
MLSTEYKNARLSFKEIKELDEQGMNSRVFLAHDKNLDCELVIKEIKIESFDCDSYFSEARKLYQSSHPNIVQVQYAAQDDTNVYIGLPFYNKGSIHNRMNHEFLTISEIVRYSIQFLSGLYHIHTKGLIHFDIKPNNILLSDRDEALLSDFGLTEKISKDGLASPELLYVKHQAPESFTDDELDFTFDVYQSGMTMYRMLIGHIQFQDEIEQICKTGAPHNEIICGRFPFKNYPYHTPKKLIKIIDKCLHKDKFCRYQSVQQILNDLSKIEPPEVDWRMDLHPIKNKTKWIANKNGATLEIEYDNDSGSCVGKRTASSGRTQRISEYCIKSATENDIRKILTK